MCYDKASKKVLSVYVVKSAQWQEGLAWTSVIHGCMSMNDNILKPSVLSRFLKMPLGICQGPVLNTLYLIRPSRAITTHFCKSQNSHHSSWSSSNSDRVIIRKTLKMHILNAENADNAGHNFDPVTDGRTECSVYEPTVHDKHCMVCPKQLSCGDAT